MEAVAAGWWSQWVGNRGHICVRYMGRVIGSKGATINDLQRRSGSDIQVIEIVESG
jgi:rRNA processing protein Krr1/Pno1